MDGWIKLHRKLLDNAIWKDCNHVQRDILITILLSVNHKPNKWIFEGKKQVVNAGEFITSLSSLAKTTGCTTQQVRTALEKFEKYEFITQKTTKKKRLIKINHWADYQLENNNPKLLGNKVITKANASNTNSSISSLNLEQQTDNKVVFATCTEHERNMNETCTLDNKVTTKVKTSNGNGYKSSLKPKQQTDNKQITNSQQTDNKQVTTNKNVRREECKNNIKERKEVYSKINFRLLKKYEAPSHAQSKLIDSWLKEINLESLVKVIDYCTLAFRYPSYKNLNVLCEEIKTKYSLTDSGVQKFIENKNKASPNNVATKPKTGQNFKQKTYQEMTKEEAIATMRRNNPALKINAKDLREE